jgi:nucleoside-diphosphate-sugar epimerase
MKIFFSGATGVIGQRLLPMLVGAGHEVTAIGRTVEQRTQLERTGATAVDVSLFDETALRLVVGGHEVVVNMATHIPSSPLGMLRKSAWAENDRIRREGVANLVDAASRGGARRFVQESFAPVYPDSAAEWIEEDVRLEPTKYNMTVVNAERSASRFTGDSVVLRFGAFYGQDARQTLAMAALVRHGVAPMPGAPSAFVSSVSHDDAAAAVVSALTIPAGTYNVTDDEPVTHREYFDSLAAALGVPPPKLLPKWTAIFFGGAGELMTRSLRVSNRKLRGASDWRPRFRSVREGWAWSVARPSKRIHRVRATQ